MDYQITPLFMIPPGKEYIIDSIITVKNGITDVHGYGLIPGTKIKMLFASPAKDPIAYEIMGTVIALRNKDAENIFVSPANPVL